MNKRILSHFTEARDVLDRFLADETNIKKVEQAGLLLVECISRDRHIFSCGNGGSMCDAMHFAEEMTGRFRQHRDALPAVAISDPAFLTCAGNDFGYDHVFSRYLEAWAKEGDVLLAISTSGNSPNVIEAAKEALLRKMKVIALTGKDGGELAGLAHVEIRAPKTEYADRAQELHIKIIHSLIDHVEQWMKSDTD